MTAPETRARALCGGVRFTIIGQPCSKSNRSQIVDLGGRKSIGKSAEAKKYIRDTLKQIPPAARQRLEGPVRFTATIYYESQRPDLDESQLLDCLQDQWSAAKKDKDGNIIRPRTLVQSGVYRNDNQVREKHVFHAIDKLNPRAEIVIEPMQPQQADMVKSLHQEQAETEELPF